MNARRKQSEVEALSGGRIAGAVLLLLLPVAMAWMELQFSARGAELRELRAAQRAARSAGDAAAGKNIANRTQQVAEAAFMEPEDAYRAAIILSVAGRRAEAQALLRERVIGRFAHAAEPRRLVLSSPSAGLTESEREWTAELAAELAILEPSPRDRPGGEFRRIGRALDAARRPHEAMTALLEAARFDDSRAPTLLDLAVVSAAADHRGMERHFLIGAMLGADFPGALMPLVANWAASTEDWDGARRLAELGQRVGKIGEDEIEALAAELIERGAPEEVAASLRANWKESKP